MSEKHHILLVDDEELIVELLENYFQSLGYDVTAVENAEKALEHLQNNFSYDLLITDINLPGKSGIDLLKITREIRPELPVILVTGHKTMDFAISAIKNGATDFITKPFQLNNVRKVVEKVIRYKLKTEKKERIFEYARFIKMDFEFPTKELDAGVLADYLARLLLKTRFCNENEVNQFYLVFLETIVNAIEHGNLELASTIKGDDFDRFLKFEQLREERLQDPTYGNRKVYIQMEVSPRMFTLTIRDEGPGFDWKAVMEKTEMETINLESHGRGFVFIQSVMDEMLFNDKGNAITLVKYKE